MFELNGSLYIKRLVLFTKEKTKLGYCLRSVSLKRTNDTFGSSVEVFEWCVFYPSHKPIYVNWGWWYTRVKLSCPDVGYELKCLSRIWDILLCLSSCYVHWDGWHNESLTDGTSSTPCKGVPQNWRDGDLAFVKRTTLVEWCTSD